MLPKDPYILRSFVNTKLRDEFKTLKDLCAALDADSQAVFDTLAALDDRYDPAYHQFI